MTDSSPRAPVSNLSPASLHVSISVSLSFQICEMDMVSLAQQGCLESTHGLFVTGPAVLPWYIEGML